MSNSKELRDGVVQGRWEMFICWFGVLWESLRQQIHRSHDILICKIFLLRKCQRTARPDCLVHREQESVHVDDVILSYLEVCLIT